MKKFWERVEAAYKKMFGSTSWEKTASSVLTYVAPVAETLVALTAGGPAATLVAGVVAAVQNDLATVSAVVSDATATPPANELAAATNALNSIKSNLSSLLNAADVKNSAKATEVTAAVNTVIGEVEAMLQAIPAAA